MKIFGIVLLVLFSATFSYAQHKEIHCKHWIYGYPARTSASNDLIIREIYAMSSNDNTKFADWVAYRLDKNTVSGNAETKRNWKSDPWLDDSETLVPSYYKDAHANLKTYRGHQAPLASFKGTGFWFETNYLSNITPQKSALNQGVWVSLESKIRKLALQNTIFVITGTLYEKDMPMLPKADEPHKIHSGYWKIIVKPSKNLAEIKKLLYLIKIHKEVLAYTTT